MTDFREKTHRSTHQSPRAPRRARQRPTAPSGKPTNSCDESRCHQQVFQSRLIGVQPPHNRGAAAPGELRRAQPRHERADLCADRGAAAPRVRAPAISRHTHALREHMASRGVVPPHLNSVLEVVGCSFQEQPPTGPPRHKARLAAAALKCSPPFPTVQNDVLEIRPFEPRPQLYIPSCNEHLSTATVHAMTAPRCL